MTRSRQFIQRRLEQALARAKKERQAASYGVHDGLAPQWGDAEQKIEDALEAARILP